MRSCYYVDRAVLQDGSERLVIVDDDDRLHVASSWLDYLYNLQRSPLTIRDYSRRVATYLNWLLDIADWRAITPSHLSMWRAHVSSTWQGSPRRGLRKRSPETVELYMIPVRSFYRWAAREDLLSSGVADHLFTERFIRPGSPGGGEDGRTQLVVAEDVRPFHHRDERRPEWIDSSEARDALEALPLNTRDRLLIDLMYFTGIRIGEALSLFTADMHLAGGSEELGCRTANPHFHVRTDNPVENGARAKGRARTLDAEQHLVERYIDYVMDRQKLLGSTDNSNHVFVNLYTKGPHQGNAMAYKSALRVTQECGRRINFEIEGPHIFRHTFATRLLRGIDCEPVHPKTVQDLLGHRSSNSTAIYSHDLEEAKRKAMKSLIPRKLNLQ